MGGDAGPQSSALLDASIQALPRAPALPGETDVAGISRSSWTKSLRERAAADGTASDRKAAPKAVQESSWKSGSGPYHR